MTKKPAALQHRKKRSYTGRQPNLSRHASKCRVCSHPNRAAIEFDFLNWRNPLELARSYGVGNLSSIYRHAHATGLFARRRLNLRFALERIVERVGEVPVTASAVIRSVRAITRIDDRGEWIEPPTRLIVSRVDASDTSARAREKIEIQANSRPLFGPALLEEPFPTAAGEVADGQYRAPQVSPVNVVMALEPGLYEAFKTRRQPVPDCVDEAAAPVRESGLIANEVHSRGKASVEKDS
jgi:hypothetical protein